MKWKQGELATDTNINFENPDYFSLFTVHLYCWLFSGHILPFIFENSQYRVAV